MNQSVFSILKDVIEEEIKEAGIEDRKILRAAMESHKQYWKSIRYCIQSQIFSPNYSDQAYRIAYLYVYFTIHVSIVQTFFGRFLPGMEAWHKDLCQEQNEAMPNINVCSIGGGPGTDLLGLHLFNHRQKWFSIINGTVFDMHPEWENSFHKLAARIWCQPHLGDIQYKKFDFFQPDSQLDDDIRSADLVTMVKFVSAVSANLSVAECIEKLEEMLKLLKPGAIFFFMDNTYFTYRHIDPSRFTPEELEILFTETSYQNLTKIAAARSGLTLIHEIQDEAFSVPDLEKLHMYKYKPGFDYDPLKTASVSAMLWRKIKAPPNPSEDLICEECPNQKMEE